MNALSPERTAPFYRPVAQEVALFEAAHANGLPLLLKGPTGCGKTRFVEHMAARLGRPLYTVACHDDLSAADLIGRYLLRGGATEWVDGPLTRAVREGAICYLDEVIEARKDVTVVLHPLTDNRRTLMIDRTGEELVAPPDFMLVASYNPGYQNILKRLKPSTRQRFLSITFGFPDPATGKLIPIFGEGGGKKLAEETGTNFLGSIPIDMKIREASDDGKAYAGDAAAIYAKIAKALS